MKTILPALMIIAAMSALLIYSISQMGIPELQVSQVFAGEGHDTKIKMHGKLLKIDQKHRPVQFHIVDKADSNCVIFVHADVTPPDTFLLDKDIAVDGVYDSVNKKFVGTKIYTKCPSKYEATDNIKTDNYEEGSPTSEEKDSTKATEGKTAGE